MHKKINKIGIDYNRRYNVQFYFQNFNTMQYNYVYSRKIQTPIFNMLWSAMFIICTFAE